MKDFYYGQGDLTGLKDLLNAEIDPREACTIPLGKDDQERIINVRIGKFGPYLERESERAAIPEDLAPDELTPERAASLFNADTALGTDQKTGLAVYLKSGRYGPFFKNLDKLFISGNHCGFFSPYFWFFVWLIRTF